MKKKTTYLLLILFTFNSCVEPFDYKTLTFESALVIQASITSENKKQAIKLTRTFKIEDSGITTESNAIVQVIDDLNNVFNFTEETPGNYISDVSFETKQDVSYQLKIKTQDGRTYTSDKQKIIGVSPIQNVIAKAVTSNENGIEKEGISISVESYDSTRKSNYYRFEYEETYKIVAPFWVPKKIKIVSRDYPFLLELIDKTEETKTCYKTNLSNKTIQTETFTLSEDRVNFPVKFIDKSDFSIKYRYSILVKQYVQTREAYTFYKTLKKLASTESLFSQNQPGTLVGNIYAEGNSNENVLGFFEITSVSSKRVFFNYTDFYEKDTRPDHIDKCSFESPVFTYFPLDDPPYSPLLYTLDSGEQVFHEKYSGPPTFPEPTPPYTLVTKSCGDCTAIGSNKKPSFWVD